jgi:ABC-type Fe3+/spermidine/putrescine transport system ATPase subunit
LRPAERYASRLSGGQQQRVAFARAIVAEPKVLLLDEPLSNLDAALREQMCAELRKLHERLRLTTLFVTHDQGEALSMSDRIAVMRDGRFVEVGTPEDLWARPRRCSPRTIGGANVYPGSGADDRRGRRVPHRPCTRRSRQIISGISGSRKRFARRQPSGHQSIRGHGRRSDSTVTFATRAQIDNSATIIRRADQLAAGDHHDEIRPSTSPSWADER